jgi:hypothetical protein
MVKVWRHSLRAWETNGEVAEETSEHVETAPNSVNKPVRRRITPEAMSDNAN